VPPSPLRRPKPSGTHFALQTSALEARPPRNAGNTLFSRPAWDLRPASKSLPKMRTLRFITGVKKGSTALYMKVVIFGALTSVIDAVTSGKNCFPSPNI